MSVAIAGSSQRPPSRCRPAHGSALSRYKVGGQIAAQLVPVTGLGETCAILNLSKNRVLQIERDALAKIAVRLKERIRRDTPNEKDQRP